MRARDYEAALSYIFMLIACALFFFRQVDVALFVILVAVFFKLD